MKKPAPTRNHVKRLLRDESGQTRRIRLDAGALSIVGLRGLSASRRSDLHGLYRRPDNTLTLVAKPVQQGGRFCMKRFSLGGAEKI